MNDFPRTRWCTDQTQCPPEAIQGDGAGTPFSGSLCLDCAVFWQQMHEFERNDGEGLVPRLSEALLESRERINHLSLQLQTKSREVAFLHDVGIFLQSSLGRDEVIAMTLTAVTAGKGYGLNRAILLLVNEERQLLEGYLAVGPRNPEDAWRIWQEIAEHDYSLKEMARHFLEEKMTVERERFRDLLEGLTVALDRHDHPFVAALDDCRSRHLVDLEQEAGLDPEQIRLLGTRELVLVPLVSGTHRIGLLLADNLVTGLPIGEDDWHSLETFALPVSYAIERAALYERLRQELSRITEAHQRLREQQQLIVRMEKLALVGELSADVAHHIRNPLAIIGGYASRMLKELPEDNPHREALSAILREAGQIAESVRHLLDYVDARHPANDTWDLGQEVETVIAGMEGELTGREIRLVRHLPAVPCVAFFDLKKIDYCLRAVIGRAVGTSPNGGVVEIAVERHDDALRVRVFGNGAPMAEQEIAAVFAPLYSGAADAGRPDVELALCARILEQQGGRLELYTRPDGGMEYNIILPRKEEVNHETIAGG